MRLHGTSLHLGLLIVGLVALTTLNPSYLSAQVASLPASQSGTVTGVVRTAAGVPASGIRITALRVESAEDAVRAMASLSQTDATGRYRLENVPPGRYYITAGRVDLPTFYPGTLDMTQGTALSVSALSVIADIDFVVQDRSATVPNAPGGFGLRSGGPGGNSVPNLGVSLNGLPVIAGLTFQAQNGGAPRSGGGGGGRGARTGGPAQPNAPLVPGQTPGGGGLGAGAINRWPAGAAWWTNSGLVARLGLTDDQKRKIEATFEQYRQTLVQNKTDLEKEEAGLARMLEAEPLEPVRTITAQIERVVQARAEMERTNSKMTLEMRQNLTRSQWVQLQSETAQPNLTPVTPAAGRSSGRGPAGPPPAVTPTLTPSPTGTR